jgi:CDP-glucose 4,6-dehydratase
VEGLVSFWTDRPVFVTGATGLLGSHIVAELLARGAAPVCLVRDEVPASLFNTDGLDRRVVVVRGELGDHALLERALGEHEIDTVLHLGAQTIVGTASRNPLSTWESNVRGSYLLLEACRRAAATVRRVVVASSDKAYGDQPNLPYTEDAPLLGRFPYDCSKACTDLIARSYFETYGLPVCVTRCGNLFGSGDLNWNRIVPGTVRAAIRGERPVVRSDGTPVRDYLFVGDAVAAYLDLAEQADRPGVAGEAFNFSDEQPLTVLAIVARTLAACARPDLEPVVLGHASHEIHAQFLSAAKARAALGWRPRFGLDDGLARTAAWYRRHFT